MPSDTISLVNVIVGIVGTIFGSTLAVFRWVCRYRPLRILVRRTDYVHFVEYPSWTRHLPWFTPRHARLRGKKLGSRLPHIPEGEVAVDLVMHNEHQTTDTEKISIEIVEFRDLPQNSRFSGVRPILDPYEDLVLIDRNCKSYPVFDGRVFSLKNGEMDLLRISILVANSEMPVIFKLRLRVDHHSGSKRFTSYSKPFYLAKYFGGRTEGNPYSNGMNISNKWKGFSNSLRSDLKPDLYCTQLYQHQFCATKCSFSLLTLRQRISYRLSGMKLHDPVFPEDLKLFPSTDYVGYLRNHFGQAALMGPRIPVETYGYVKNGFPVSESMLVHASIASLMSIGNVIMISYSNDSSDLEKVWIYQTRRSAEFTHLCIAACRIANDGTEAEKLDATKFLVNISYDENADVAATIDLISLLGLFPNHISYDRIVEFLSSDNAIIQDKAAQMLIHTRYKNANTALLEITQRNDSFAKESAYKALALCGDKRIAQQLHQALEDGNIKPNEINLAKDTIFDIDPDLAIEWGINSIVIKTEDDG